MEITREKILEVLTKYISEDKPYLFYDQNMYPNFLNKNELINRITNELVKDKNEHIPSCICGMDGDMSGLDKDGCSCIKNKF